MNLLNLQWPWNLWGVVCFVPKSSAAVWSLLCEVFDANSPLSLAWVGQQMPLAFLHGANVLYSLLLTRHRLLMDHFFFVPFWCFRIIIGKIVSLLFSTRENRSHIRILDFVLLSPFAFYINDYIGVKHIMQANNAFKVCNYYVEGGNESLLCIQKNMLAL